MFDLYTVLKFLHVLLAVFWVGSGLLLTILAARAKASTDPAAVGRFASEAEWLGARVFGPTSGLLLLMGIFLVLKGYPDFTDTWIILGIVGWAASTALGFGILAPAGKRLDEILQTKPSSDPEARAVFDKLIMVSRVDLTLLVLVIADMVFKPGVNG